VYKFMYKTTGLCDIRNHIFADFHAPKKLRFNLKKDAVLGVKKTQTKLMKCF